MIELIGWSASIVLLMTLVKQVHKQWKDRTSEGISKWLFTGQLAASVGFTIYSVMTGNWVFAFTNAALTVNNLVGIWLYFHFRDAGEGDPTDNEASGFSTGPDL